MYYLMSRYGLKITKEQVQNLIFKDLAGGSNETDCLDICEVVAILLIPFLVKTAKGDIGESIKNRSTIKRAFSDEIQFTEYLGDLEMQSKLISKGQVIQHVLNIILADSTGSTEPRSVTKELIQTIFARYGELELIQDDQLIEDMILDVTGGDPETVLDATTFSRALCNDVMLYDVKKEARVTTFFDDVFGESVEKTSKKSIKGHNPLNQDPDPQDVEAPSTTNQDEEVENVFTFSQIDFLADGSRSKMHLAMVYLSFVFAVFRYRQTPNITVCTPAETFGCRILNSTTLWVLIMSITM